jgi:hypothetical protein
MTDASDRAFIATMCDYADAQLDRYRADADAQILAIKEEWSSNAASQMAESEARVRRLQEDSLAWLRSRYDDEPRKLAGSGDHREEATASAASPGTGHSPRTQQPGQHELELAEAARIRNLTMQQFAIERQTLIRSGKGIF